MSTIDCKASNSQAPKHSWTLHIGSCVYNDGRKTFFICEPDMSCGLMEYLDIDESQLEHILEVFRETPFEGGVRYDLRAEALLTDIQSTWIEDHQRVNREHDMSKH